MHDKIIYGWPFDEERCRKAVHDACLKADLELLSNNDLTEVGLCHGIDSFSALDAHIGKSVRKNVFLGAATDKMCVLIVHMLHLLPQVNYIYTTVKGHSTEYGTYAALMAADHDFVCFVCEFGSSKNHLELLRPLPSQADLTITVYI
ncbi:Multidrug resistance-associated protein 1 [Trametes pubescens]|uniref:Multidrug resistance-associated protein 1 n=1 Tax=Trametes pubescens TaxID=154538 RepID=A0A1M2VCE6_TRAPU|nr:Multidrug resistance-associated protein 1 [Trametes pubescens]